MNSDSNYNEIAGGYCEKHFDLIKAKADKKKNVFNKLEFLFRSHRECEVRRLTSAPNEQTPIKTTINNYYELNDDIGNYILSSQFDEDQNKLVAIFDDTYGKYIEDGAKTKSKSSKNSTSIKPTKKYLENNKTSLPHEILESFQVSGTTDISAVTGTTITGICYGMILLKEKIESEIELVLSDNSISKEAMEEIQSKFGGKIQWGSTVSSLAVTINSLVSQGSIIIERNDKKIADITFLHFYVPGKVAGSEYSVRTLYDRIKDTK
jgi:hypothetical protein